jgi:hypothetical protein
MESGTLYKKEGLWEICERKEDYEMMENGQMDTCMVSGVHMPQDILNISHIYTQSKSTYANKCFC